MTGWIPVHDPAPRDATMATLYAMHPNRHGRRLKRAALTVAILAAIMFLLVVLHESLKLYLIHIGPIPGRTIFLFSFVTFTPLAPTLFLIGQLVSVSKLPAPRDLAQ